MPRHVLTEAQIHPAIREKIATRNREFVEEVMQATTDHDIVVVGMSQNPFPRRARRLLDDLGIPHHYMEFGSYLPGWWRKRNALKMWTGWPTFPMIWIGGVFIGGFRDLERLREAGELDALR
jgi:glutaredoxin-related protein